MIGQAAALWRLTSLVCVKELTVSVFSQAGPVLAFLCDVHPANETDHSGSARGGARNASSGWPQGDIMTHKGVAMSVYQE